MKNPTERFLEHLRVANPRFRCEPAGGKSGATIEVKIHHELGRPATAKQLEMLPDLVGSHAAALKPLYAKHNGGTLYVQRADNAALVLFPINQWAKATRRFKKDLEEWGRDPKELYAFERKGVVFGEPWASGNHFFLYGGAVYYSDHDGGDDTPLAKSFDAFLDRIVNDPARFLYDIGCYARYYKGRSKEQWIPNKFLSR